MLQSLVNEVMYGHRSDFGKEFGHYYTCRAANRAMRVGKVGRFHRLCRNVAAQREKSRKP
jgi:hypothetical protein